MLPRVDEVTCEQVAREFDDRGPGVCVARISGEMQRSNPEILDMALRCARDVGKPEEVMVGMCMFYSLLLTQGLRLPKGTPATGSGSLQFSLPHVRAHTRDVIVVQIERDGSEIFTQQWLSSLERDNPQLLQMAHLFASRHADYLGVMQGFVLLYACLDSEARAKQTRLH